MEFGIACQKETPKKITSFVVLDRLTLAVMPDLISLPRSAFRGHPETTGSVLTGFPAQTGE